MGLTTVLMVVLVLLLTCLSATLNGPVKMAVISWNMAEKAPNALDASFLKTYNSSDIVVFGIQECEDIRPRRREGHRTRRWRDLQRKFLGKDFSCLASHKMGGLFMSIYMKKNIMKKVQGVQLVDVACGVGNVLTNKGAVGAVLRINNKTIALINSHLAAHQKYVKRRNADFHRIMNAISDAAQPMKKHFKESHVVNKAIVTYPTESTQKIVQSVNRQAKGNLRKIQGKVREERGRKIKKAWIPSSITHMLLNTNTRKKKHRLPARLAQPNTPSRIPMITSKPPLSLEELSTDKYPFHAAVFFGDLNYRVDLPREEIVRVHNRLLKVKQQQNGNLESFSAGNGGSKQSKQTRSSSETVKQGFLGWDNRYFDTATPPDAGKSANLIEVIVPNLTIQMQKLLARLLRHDQLNRQKKMNKAFLGFQEGPIQFPPTYKYDPNKSSFDSSAKRRCPAWTDRVLYFVKARNVFGSSPGCNIVRNCTELMPDSQSCHTQSESGRFISNAINKPLSNRSCDQRSALGEPQLLLLRDYYSVDARTSDHRPVCAEFDMYL